MPNAGKRVSMGTVEGPLGARAGKRRATAVVKRRESRAVQLDELRRDRINSISLESEATGEASFGPVVDAVDADSSNSGDLPPRVSPARRGVVILDDSGPNFAAGCSTTALRTVAFDARTRDKFALAFQVTQDELELAELQSAPHPPGYSVWKAMSIMEERRAEPPTHRGVAFSKLPVVGVVRPATPPEDAQVNLDVAGGFDAHLKVDAGAGRLTLFGGCMAVLFCVRMKGMWNRQIKRELVDPDEFFMAVKQKYTRDTASAGSNGVQFARLQAKDALRKRLVSSAQRVRSAKASVVGGGHPNPYRPPAFHESTETKLLLEQRPSTARNTGVRRVEVAPPSHVRPSRAQTARRLHAQRKATEVQSSADNMKDEVVASSLASVLCRRNRCLGEYLTKGATKGETNAHESLNEGARGGSPVESGTCSTEIIPPSGNQTPPFAGSVPEQAEITAPGTVDKKRSHCGVEKNCDVSCSPKHVVSRDVQERRIPPGAVVPRADVNSTGTTAGSHPDMQTTVTNSKSVESRDEQVKVPLSPSLRKVPHETRLNGQHFQDKPLAKAAPMWSSAGRPIRPTVPQYKQKSCRPRNHEEFMTLVGADDREVAVRQQQQLCEVEKRRDEVLPRRKAFLQFHLCTGQRRYDTISSALGKYIQAGRRHDASESRDVHKRAWWGDFERRIRALENNTTVQLLLDRLRPFFDHGGDGVMVPETFHCVLADLSDDVLMTEQAQFILRHVLRPFNVSFVAFRKALRARHIPFVVVEQ